MTSKTNDNDWMSIVDLINSSVIQLAPYPDSQKKFLADTDRFFTELELLERDAHSSDASVIETEVG